MSNLICPFYNKACILKEQANLPDFKVTHDCKSLINNCSFFIKEKLKQCKANTQIKIIIRKIDNVYSVKADGLVYPTNMLLEIDDPLLNRMTFNEAQSKCNEFLLKTIHAGCIYDFPVPSNWKIKQKHFLNAIIAGESRLVNSADVAKSMKKAILYADNIGLESLLILPCDNGTHDISTISMSQLSAIFTISKQHKFINLKSIYICMGDEETEQTFIEYYNRIFGSKHESGNETDITINN